jgi:hypothetical protein
MHAVVTSESRKRFNFFIVFLIILIGTPKGFGQTFVDSCPPISADIVFKKGTVVLTPKAKIRLDSVYRVMKNYSACKISIEGHSGADEGAQQISWDKVASVVRYLRSKGLNKNNFLFSYGLDGDPSIVNITSSTEEGPDWVPAPHPCFSLHLPRKKRCIDTHGHMLH